MPWHSSQQSAAPAPTGSQPLHVHVVPTHCGVSVPHDGLDAGSQVAGDSLSTDPLQAANVPASSAQIPSRAMDQE